MTKRIRKRGGKGGRQRDSRLYPIDKAWKLGIRALLAERKISQAALSRLVKASPAAITLLLQDDGATASTLVAAIHEVLGLVAPPPESMTTIERIPQPDTAAA